MGLRELSPEIISAAVQAKIEHEFQREDYRPTVMIILFNNKGELLLFESPKVDNPGDKTTWSFPQGGVDPITVEGVITGYELATDAIIRELEEESAIRKDEVTIVRFLGSKTIDFPPTRKDKRNFNKGKCYLAYEVMYSGNNTFQLGEGQVVTAKWVKVEDLFMYLDPKKEKTQFILRMLERVKRLRNKARENV